MGMSLVALDSEIMEGYYDILRLLLQQMDRRMTLIIEI